MLLIVLAAMMAFSGIAPHDSNARRAPVLGQKGHMGPYGKGWGKVRPKRIFNGGVPSGLIQRIRWTGWGGRTAKGTGRGHQYRPDGGYYAKRVAVRLRATRLDRCHRRGPRAYTRLKVRMQKWPGGPFGEWFLWAGDRTICGKP